MIGIVQISPKEAFGLTYRRLYQIYIAHQLDRWDQCTMLASLAQNIVSVICGVVGVHLRPMTPLDFHPYRPGGNPNSSGGTSGDTRVRIDKENFDTLKTLGDLIMKKRL